MIEWTAPDILEACGYNPATCDDIYKSAALCLEVMQGRESAVIEFWRSKGTGPNASRGTRVFGAVRVFAAELEIPQCEIEWEYIDCGVYRVTRREQGSEE